MRIIIALGVAGLIVTQGTDLSAGRQVGLAAVIAATLLQSMENANKVFPEMATMPIFVVILIVCAIGAVIGLINGIYHRLPERDAIYHHAGYDDHRLRYQLPLLRLRGRVSYLGL